jgi:hypothetical protein
MASGEKTIIHSENGQIFYLWTKKSQTGHLSGLGSPAELGGVGDGRKRGNFS